MTNPTLERAARALCSATGADWDAISPTRQQYAVTAARAVLSAVREPGEDVMASAFHDVLEPVYPTDFTRICDAILAEGE